MVFSSLSLTDWESEKHKILPGRFGSLNVRENAESERERERGDEGQLSEYFLLKRK